MEVVPTLEDVVIELALPPHLQIYKRLSINQARQALKVSVELLEDDDDSN